MHYKNITQTKASPMLQDSTQLKPGSIVTDPVSGSVFSFRQKEEQLLPLREIGFFSETRSTQYYLQQNKKKVLLHLVLTV